MNTVSIPSVHPSSIPACSRTQGHGGLLEPITAVVGSHTHTHTHTPMDNLEFSIHLTCTCFWTMEGSQREPKQTQGEQATSTEESNPRPSGCEACRPSANTSIVFSYRMLFFVFFLFSLSTILLYFCVLCRF